MLEYTTLDENTNIIISSLAKNGSPLVEGLIATPTTHEDMYQELIDISNNGGAYASTFNELNQVKYQFNSNDAVVYDPNHPDYIATIRETALMDTHDYMNYQSTILGVTSVALLGLIVGSMFFSSKRV